MGGIHSMLKIAGFALPAILGVLALGLPRSAAAKTRVEIYGGYAAPYYEQPYNYAPYGNYGAYYGDDGWRDRDRRWRREEEHREHEWRERQRREREHREHERREHDRRW
jgi:hypothetical protein